MELWYVEDLLGNIKQSEEDRILPKPTVYYKWMVAATEMMRELEDEISELKARLDHVHPID